MFNSKLLVITRGYSLFVFHKLQAPWVLIVSTSNRLCNSSSVGLRKVTVPSGWKIWRTTARRGRYNEGKSHTESHRQDLAEIVEITTQHIQIHEIYRCKNCVSQNNYPIYRCSKQRTWCKMLILLKSSTHYWGQKGSLQTNIMEYLSATMACTQQLGWPYLN